MATRANDRKRAATLDFQLCDILTSVDSEEPVQLILSLVTPNDVQFVAKHSYKIQATSKGPDQIAHADLRLCWSHISHCWKMLLRFKYL